MPATAATSVSLGSTALSNAPVTEPVPVPSGYSQSISIPLVSTAANTTVSIKSGTTVPAGLAPLSRSRSRAVFARRRDDASDPYTTIFYTSFQPSANITVAGNISANQAFPAGTLNTSTPYYLGFYDTTQASPAWQTISGPVMSTDGLSLTFSGTVGSTTLVANALYGFAIFSTVTPSATPPPAPQTLLYFGDGTTLTIASESGTIETQLAIPNQSFDLDDAGNVYAANYYAAVPSAPPSPIPLMLTKYPAGSATPSATYLPSKTDSGSFLSASGSGELASVYLPRGGTDTSQALVADVWDPGVVGAPSRTLTTTTAADTFVMTHDGTLYLPDTSPSGAPQYDVFPPGASTPSSIIPETIVTPAQYANFFPNYGAVGPDGTLYITEYAFAQPDPLAGTYIYPPGGTERFIPAVSNANGPGPEGVDVDGSGNIYVVNNNAGYTNNFQSCQEDTLSEVTVYSSSGTLLRTIPTTQAPYPITVAADGTAFYSTFGPFCTNQDFGTIASILPGANTATQIFGHGSTEIVLYDGTHKTNPLFMGRSGGSSGHGGGASRAIRRFHFMRRR